MKDGAVFSVNKLTLERFKIILNSPTCWSTDSKRCKVINLELIAFVEPLVPLKDPVENGVERGQHKTVFH